jgi:NTP pyrophosphatase (non-canonical NTP hydrolase)
MKEIFYLYHIPGKKIGITRNLKDRVTRQQGYTADEYEVLLTSDDIDYISDKEIELQKSYGYKVDRQKYNSLTKKNNNNMKINVTEQTTTFPVPIAKLRGRLMDNIGLKWKHPEFGTFEITKDNIPWILSNAKISMYNTQRCYIYNKAFYASEKPSTVSSTYTEKSFSYNNTESVYDLIRSWATDKGIYRSGDARTQFVKLMEEAGELAQAILKNDEPEVIDAIGDMVVVLTNLAKLRGHNIEDCITSAYDVISNRTGKMINGTFVKQESLNETL